jgi:hypothetical protein
MRCSQMYHHDVCKGCCKDNLHLLCPTIWRALCHVAGHEMAEHENCQQPPDSSRDVGNKAQEGNVSLSFDQRLETVTKPFEFRSPTTVQVPDTGQSQIALGNGSLWTGYVRDHAKPCVVSWISSPACFCSLENRVDQRLQLSHIQDGPPAHRCGKSAMLPKWSDPAKKHQEA